MKIQGTPPVQGAHGAKVSKIAQKAVEQQGEAAVKLIESATVPEGTKGHNIDKKV